MTVIVEGQSCALYKDGKTCLALPLPGHIYFYRRYIETTHNTTMGLHLNMGVQDNSVWKSHWRQLAA